MTSIEDTAFSSPRNTRSLGGLSQTAEMGHRTALAAALPGRDTRSPWSHRSFSPFLRPAKESFIKPAVLGGRWACWHLYGSKSSTETTLFQIAVTSLKHQNFQMTEAILSDGLKLLEETEAQDIHPFPEQPFLMLLSSTTLSYFRNQICRIQVPQPQVS